MKKSKCLITLLVIIFILALTPPHRNKSLRQLMGEMILKIWSKSGAIMAVIYQELWSKGNGY